MLKTIVLICAVSTPAQDCSEHTALDIVRVAPSKTASMCGLFGQAGIAATAIRPEAGKSYQKIVCTRAAAIAR